MNCGLCKVEIGAGSVLCVYCAAKGGLDPAPPVPSAVTDDRPVVGLFTKDLEPADPPGAVPAIEYVPGLITEKPGVGDGTTDDTVAIQAKIRHFITSEEGVRTYRDEVDTTIPVPTPKKKGK